MCSLQADAIHTAQEELGRQEHLSIHSESPTEADIAILEDNWLGCLKHSSS